ncbi:MAG: hypothetical protein COA58_09420 [Bacteroidetes bacterium]|nr:MAG: hypothetical protein COA58_09420 [Bacteroidota bacterium]
MRKLITLLTLILVLATYAQQDSSDIIFGYDDSTKINVTIDLEDPLQDLHSTFFFGVGTVGPVDKSAVALHLKYDMIFDAYSGLSFKAITTFQDYNNSGVLYLEGMGHKSLKEVIRKSNMKLKLTSSSKENKQTYYASYPFQVRHQLVFDGGLSVAYLNEDIQLLTINTDTATLLAKDRNYINALLGLSYVRTRNVSLTLNNVRSLHYFTKLTAGVSLGLNVGQGGVIIRTDSSGESVAEGSDLENFKLSALGVGFDFNYQFETAKPRWALAFDISGRFMPRYKGDAHFYDKGNYSFKSDYTYSSGLFIMPSISLGFIMN